MANEATITCSLRILKGSLDYVSRPEQFRADVSVAKGSTPGNQTIPVGGKSIDLSELTTPGFCRIMNLDETNYVEFGTYDPDTDVFYPLLEIGPGESYIYKLSRNLNEEYSGTGTGTTGPSN